MWRWAERRIPASFAGPAAAVSFIGTCHPGISCAARGAPMAYNSDMVRSNGPRGQGPAYLTVVVDNREVQRRPLTGPITVGRSLECDLFLEDPLLSRRHCQLEPALEGDGWVLIEL